MRRDGSTHLMRGVVIFTVTDGEIDHATFYLEPVAHDESTVDTAVRLHVGAP